MLSSSYILNNLLPESNLPIFKDQDKSYLFPLPVSGQNLIEIYSVLFFAAKDKNIICSPRISIASNLHYTIRIKEKSNKPNSNTLMEVKPIIDERLVDLYYGYMVTDLVRKYLIIQNPKSPNWYSRSIFIPKGMEKEFVNVYCMIYRNLPYNPHNENVNEKGEEEYIPWGNSAIDRKSVV